MEHWTGNSTAHTVVFQCSSVQSSARFRLELASSSSVDKAEIIQRKLCSKNKNATPSA